MRRGLLGAVLVVVTAFVLLLSARVARAQLLSPGPLSKAHASLEGRADDE